MIKGTKGFWDILGEILAIVLVVIYALLIINATFNFIPAGTFLSILEIIRTYGSLALIVIVGFEAMAERHFIFKIIFLALLAIIIVFMFFPETYVEFINVIQK